MDGLLIASDEFDQTVGRVVRILWQPLFSRIALREITLLTFKSSSVAQSGYLSASKMLLQDKLDALLATHGAPQSRHSLVF